MPFGRASVIVPPREDLLFEPGGVGIPVSDCLLRVLALAVGGDLASRAMSFPLIDDDSTTGWLLFSEPLINLPIVLSDLLI